MTANVQKKEASTASVTLVRVFDAPRSLVFKAWTDPELMAKWWGPKDFTNPVCELRAPGWENPHRHARPRWHRVPDDRHLS
jgi:uncharacterized protein YndB with AHSA1/START domain